MNIQEISFFEGEIQLLSPQRQTIKRFACLLKTLKSLVLIFLPYLLIDRVLILAVIGA